jgi:DNA-binding NarL/FixJ family response regulator
VTVRLVVADDHPLILGGLESLFAGISGFQVHAGCSSGQEALREVRRSHPDVLIVDLHMPAMGGIAVARAVKEEGIPTRVVILTETIDEREALDCLQAGVAGIVLKDMAPSLLFHCVEKVAQGDVWVEKRSFSCVLEYLLKREAGTQRLAGKLSVREMQVVRLCAQGATNADIAKSLWLTEGTVKAHLHKAYRKLDVQGRAGLTRFAHDNGLI